MNTHPIAQESLEIARQAVSKARPGEQLEAYVQDMTITTVAAYGGEVESFKSARTKGLGIRYIQDGKLGYAYSAALDPDSVDSVIQEARDNSSASSQDDANVLPPPTVQKQQLDIFLESATSVSAESKVSFALDLEALTLKADPRVRAVDSANVRDVVGHKAIASTTGVEVAWSQTASICWVIALAGEANESQSGIGLATSRDSSKLNLEKASTEAATKAVRLLGAKKVPTAKVPALLDPYAAVQLLQVIATAASGSEVVKGRSLLASKLDTQIGAGVLSVVDDGTLEGGFFTAPYDAEGVATGRRPLIQDGVLRSFLHNSWSANRLGTTSTGNAARLSFKTLPAISPTNLYIQAGTKSPQALIEGISEGFFVQDLMGIHSGVDPVSGQMSVGATGLWIKDGALAQPVKEVTVATTLFDLLKNVQELGSDLEFFPIGAGIGAPSIVVAEVTVAGT